MKEKKVNFSARLCGVKVCFIHAFVVFASLFYDIQPTGTRTTKHMEKSNSFVVSLNTHTWNNNDKIKEKLCSKYLLPGRQYKMEQRLESNKI